MNAQNLRQRWRKRVEKIGGNSGGRGAINFKIPLRIFGGGNHVERAQRTRDERVFNHRAYETRGGSSPCAFNRLKYAPVLFFFNYYLRVRRDSVVRAILRFTAQSGTAIETIAINNLWYRLRENTERAKHRKKVCNSHVSFYPNLNKPTDYTGYISM